ncbi:GGDEF domain-containing protein [Shewanella livingstonensis]|uniref:diguanylate cyclase n=1 Tax=Shewanella livingstonensis TaxID=150120 RepID=A0A3G8M143_9GAMM|nr:GGDEF domain-containing protein [Shewanella livingstonensis]AZG74852.1 GGDEF domain-containing protein [Shewanella livingstonensis]
MESPFTYILITLFFSSILLSIIFLMTWQTMGKQKYALMFSLSFLASSVLWANSLFKSLFLSHNLYWMIGCSVSMLSVLLGTWGHCLRTNTKINPATLLSLGVFGMALTYYFTYISPHLGLRMSLYLYIDVVLLMITSVVIIQHRIKSRPAEIGASALHFIFAVCLFIAASIALAQGKDMDVELIKWYAIVNFTALPAAYVGMSVFVIYMLASDLAEEMKLLAMTDLLTNCLNRRGFYIQAKQTMLELQKQQQHVCLIYWDIDKFKAINDQFGHAGGDQVLISITQLIKLHIKKDDLIGRMGGEEFVILVGRSHYQDAINVAERLRAIINHTPIPFGEQKINVTASFGVVELNDQNIPIEQAIDLADTALYQAKSSGRNKVVFSEPQSF